MMRTIRMGKGVMVRDGERDGGDWVWIEEDKNVSGRRFTFEE